MGNIALKTQRLNTYKDLAFLMFKVKVFRVLAGLHDKMLNGECNLKGCILLLLALLSGCSTSTRDAASEPEQTFAGLRDGVLVYQGVITQDANNSLFAAYEGASEKPTRLVISSKGGEIGVGMALGNWVAQQQLEVQVGVVCASACANYVFPAGKTKYLAKDSVLMWHGSAWQQEWDISAEHKAMFDVYLNTMRQQETAFYARIGVDNALSVYGQNAVTFWDLVTSLFGKSTIGYDYSLDDMARFGITNIVLLDDEWDWRKYRTEKQHLVKRVPLNDDFSFTLHRFAI